MIMRDVNNGWLIRYLHSNTASAFFLLVSSIELSSCFYLHIFVLKSLPLSFFPSLVLAGKSTASAEEIEAKEKELEKQIKELEENEEERKKVDVTNTEAADRNASRAELDSSEELEAWDEVIKQTKETIGEILDWLAG